MSEYADPISPEKIALAVERALDLRRAAPEHSLDHVREAVAHTICALESADDLERHLSGTHAGALGQVMRSVEPRLAAAPRQAKGQSSRRGLGTILSGQ